MRFPLILLLTLSLLSFTKVTYALQPQTKIVSKIFGRNVNQDIYANDPVRSTTYGYPLQNMGYHSVVGTDLGAVAVYKNRLFFLLGDTQICLDCFDQINRNFHLAYSKPLSEVDYDSGVILAGYVGGGPPPVKLISYYPGDTKNIYLPSALFKINWGGTEHLFSHFMNVDEVAGNDHHIYYSGFAKFKDTSASQNGTSGIFEHYKHNTYRWEGWWRHFGMASFHVDYAGGYLYMVGSSSGRFGGVKLARITLDKFMNSADLSDWQYLMQDDNWSLPTRDFAIIQNAKWLVPPKSSCWSVTNIDLEDTGTCPVTAMTIAEFNVTYNPFLKKYLILTGRNYPTSQGGGVFYYTATNIWGPYSSEQRMDLAMAGGSNAIETFQWEPYGTFTAHELNLPDGRMYFVGTLWGSNFPPTNYGVYWYKSTLLKSTCGYVKNCTTLAPISGVQIKTYNDTFGQRSATSTTDSSGYWEIPQIVRQNDAYAVSVTGSIPSGYVSPQKTTSLGFNWNYCINPNPGTQPWGDTPYGSGSYECQVANSGVDCAGPDNSGTDCRCSFCYEPIPTSAPGDLNSDTKINLLDLVYLLNHWGEKPEYGVSMLTTIIKNWN